MNKQLALEYHMDTGVDPLRYDSYTQQHISTDFPSEEYTEWLEEKEMDRRNIKPESKYLVFGWDIVNAIEEDGLDEVVQQAEDGEEFSFETYEWIAGSGIEELLCNFEGWGKYLFLEEYEYDKLNNIESCI